MILSGRLQRLTVYSLWLATLLCFVAFIVVALSPARAAEEKFSALYNRPLYGAFFWWLSCRLRENTRPRISMVAIDLIVICLAASRFFGPIVPSSGHALFLCHTLITVRDRWYRTVAGMMLVATVAVKLSWADHRSWVWGIAFGLALGLLYRRAGKTFDRHTKGVLNGHE